MVNRRASLSVAGLSPTPRHSIAEAEGSIPGKELSLRFSVREGPSPRFGACPPPMLGSGSQAKGHEKTRGWQGRSICHWWPFANAKGRTLPEKPICARGCILYPYIVFHELPVGNIETPAILAYNLKAKDTLLASDHQLLFPVVPRRHSRG